jgi:hypothetical protein
MRHPVSTRIRSDDPVGLRGGMDDGPGQALDDAIELDRQRRCRSVEAVGEAREIALGVLGADVVIVSAVLVLPSTVFTYLNGAHPAGCLGLPRSDGPVEGLRGYAARAVVWTCSRS